MSSRTDLALRRLQRSGFRSRFTLSPDEVDYCRTRGRAVISEHAERFLTERLAPAEPRNDGRQTPWRGHPVFVAQHATATCCRGCVMKWHGIEQGRQLSADEVSQLVDLIMGWLTEQLTQEANRSPR